MLLSIVLMHERLIMYVGDNISYGDKDSRMVKADRLSEQNPYKKNVTQLSTTLYTSISETAASFKSGPSPSPKP